MKYTLATTALLLSLAHVFPARSEVTFDWATVGNPGNPFDAETGLGSVSYTYRISKHEVTNSQYAEFLNAVDPAGMNGLSLYNSEMSTDALGGIDFNGGALNGSKFAIKSGRENNPVVYVSYFDAMRFVNWLCNGQGNGGTESGAYTVSEGLVADRTPGATYFVPNENEWYKAAYHKNDGVTDNYWDYPTSTNSPPYSAPPPGTAAPNPANTANFEWDDNLSNGYNDGYAIDDASGNRLTNVGAYTQSVSPYGTFDQGGNAWELAAPNFSGETCFALRGGGWNRDLEDLHAGFAAGFGAESNRDGFRVVADAVVPLPSTLPPPQFLFSVETGRAIGDIAVDRLGKVYVTTPNVAVPSKVQVYGSDGSFDFEFGSQGNGDSQFGLQMGGMDIDQHGNVYVVNPNDGFFSNNDRVLVFDSAGNFKFTFGSSGTGNGQFAGAAGIAIDSDRGHVAVTDYGNKRIQVFDLAGNFQFAFTAFESFGLLDLAIDDDGNFLAVQPNRVHVFDSVGNFLSGFSSVGRSIDVDAEGNVYLAGSKIAVFDSTGNYEYSFGSGGRFAIDENLRRIYVANGRRIDVYQLVPEPNSIALLMLGSLFFALKSSRRDHQDLEASSDG